MQGATKFSSAGGGLRRLLPVWLAGSLAMAACADTIMVTNTANSGPGSFQQAILMANTNPGLDTIVFQISGAPPFTITPTNALPAITDPVVIDATTQPGFTNKPVIELNGALTSGSTIGLHFSSGSSFSTLRGMAINRFPVQAIQFDSAASSNKLQGNFIGTDVTGTLARGNGASTYPGIFVTSSGNLIGGTNSGDGNLISGNNDTGLYLLNANNNLVQGNLIGVNAAGTAALGNQSDGIIIYGSSSGNVIGGSATAARNVISGNGASGIYLTGTAATGNVIQGNRIGTDSSGSNAVSNLAGDGITISSAPGNTISSNLISGNGLAGVSISGASATGNWLLGNFLGPDVNGRVALTNHNSGVAVSGGGGNQIGGTNVGAGNVISGNVLDGITLTGGTATNLIQGNLIGLTAAGATALRNGQNGISISGGFSNLVGGAVAAARNVISGNAINGIAILQLTDSGNIIQGNYIGTDVTGATAIQNALAGVRIQGCNNTVGGTAAGAGNVISGNTKQGVFLSGTNGNVTGNVIQGNFIGLNATGLAGVGNGISTSDSAGIGISGAAANLVGGTAANARNVISANNGAGVFLYTNGATGNFVQGNYIGTDPSGTIAQGNILEGIYVESATANWIGGTAAGAGNLISANYAQGVYFNSASSNIVQGNFIGTKADGTNNLGNNLHNVELQTNANNNIIGGAAAGAGNRLAFASMYYHSGYYSNYCGVRVRNYASNNLISANSIFSNGALGIDLSPTDGINTYPGVNPIVDCENGVGAKAANGGQNFPTISNVVSGAGTRIRGALDAKAGKAYTLQFFASLVGDPSGYGEGQVYLGQTNLTLGSSSCSSNFTVNLPVSVSPGWVVTATATDTNNNTSEFSAWVSVIPVPPIQLALPSQSQLSLSWTNNGGSFALQQTTSLTPPITWLVVTNLPALQNNFMVATLGLTTNCVFYRLIAP